MFSSLEDLDFADDIALLSSRQDHMQDKTNELTHYSSRLGLHINASKTKEMRINAKSTQNLTINNEDVEKVDVFPYLGSIMSPEDPTTKDIQSRLNKARLAFRHLYPVWKSKQYSRRTKVQLYNSNVKSVLLYGSECWRMTKKDFQKIASFHHSCLRKICRIFWPNKISNKDQVILHPRNNQTATVQMAWSCSTNATG